MTSSATPDFLSDVLGTERIPSSKLAYFETRLSARVHQAMLKIFERLEREKNFTRKQLAQRIGKKPEQITRWFSYPGNLTLATASDIFLGMGYEIESVTLVDLASGRRAQHPDRHLDWARMADLYLRDRAEPMTHEPPLKPEPRKALRDQSEGSRRVETLSYYSEATTSFSRFRTAHSREAKKATASQCQAGRAPTSHTMGQEA